MLLVLWLPAVGNLIAYLVRKIPRRAPQARGFAAGAVFMPHLQVRLAATGLVADLPSALASAGNCCTLIVGKGGFTARLEGPLPAQPDQVVALELLRPSVALASLQPGTEFHLLIGATAAAKGRVVEVTPLPGLPAERGSPQAPRRSPAR
ncbi:MAG TPA: hypothetical protein VFB71_14380 [Ramlibacter sp.]|nr:hypothetical protein [Ramlibacter sp.]